MHIIVCFANYSTLFPMTVEKRKEVFSFLAINALMNHFGYGLKSYSGNDDYGIDADVIEYDIRTLPNGNQRFFATTRDLKVQLKATSLNQLSFNDGIISYQYRSKNYNDMVEHLRFAKRPSFLFLIILPEDINDCLTIGLEELVLKNKCYWYTHPEGTGITDNKNSKTIKIPAGQIIDSTTIPSLLDKVFK